MAKKTVKKSKRELQQDRILNLENGLMSFLDSELKKETYTTSEVNDVLMRISYNFNKKSLLSESQEVELKKS